MTLESAVNHRDCNHLRVSEQKLANVRRGPVQNNPHLIAAFIATLLCALAAGRPIQQARAWAEFEAQRSEAFCKNDGTSLRNTYRR